MSDPQGPREEAADPERKPEPPQAGAQPPTESEPAPSAAPPPDSETAATQQQPPPPPGGATAGPPPYGMPPGHYVFVPDGRRDRAFGPAFGRFARNRATHLVAAVVVGALIGGGTVAIFDNAVNHPGQRVEQFRPGGDHQFPGFRFGQGGQGFGN